MRSGFILTTLIVLLIVGYLVIQNMNNHTQTSESGRVEKIEQARQAAVQAKKKAENLRDTVNSNFGEVSELP